MVAIRIAGDESEPELGLHESFQGGAELAPFTVHYQHGGQIGGEDGQFAAVAWVGHRRSHVMFGLQAQLHTGRKHQHRVIRVRFDWLSSKNLCVKACVRERIADINNGWA